MKFKYGKFPAEPNEAFPDRIKVLRPTLNVIVKHKDKELDYLVLLDSGADYNIFHAELGEYLDLDVKSGKKLNFTGTGGEQQSAYFHHVILKVGGWEYKCYCGFSYDIKQLPTGLLGQDDFFKKFKVIFDYSNEEFELRPKDEN